MADRISKYFVPAVVAVSVVAFAAWMAWGPAPRLAYAVVAAVSVSLSSVSVVANALRLDRLNLRD